LSYIGQRPVVGRYIKLDQISSGFNGSNTGFSMTAGSQAVFPGTARNLLLSLGGVIQEPDTDFTISGSTLTFTTPPVANTTFFGVIYGDMQATGTPSDGTVLPASIASSGNFSFPQLTVTSSASLLGGAVFNENGADVDFRVEGDTEANLLFVDASTDRVGIGTSSPAFELHVGGSGQQDLLIGSTDAGGARLILDGDSNGDGSGGDFAEIMNTTGGDLSINARNPSSDAVITFSNNGSERMRIDSSGRLLIGTTTEGTVDSDDLTIATSGNTGMTIRSGTTSNGAIHFSDATSGAAEYAGYIDYDHNVDKFDMGNNSGRFLSSDSNRVVSIGKANFGGSSGVIGYGNTGGIRKDSILALNASATVAGRGAGISVGGSSSALGSFYCSKSGNADSDGGGVFLESVGALRFLTGGANDRAIIDSSGNVGIGTTSPSSLFNVDGGSANTPIEIDGTGRYRGFEIHEGGTRKAYFQHDATDNLTRLQTLEGDLVFLTSDVEQMRLSGPNLGIGTTSPDTPLTVSRATTGDVLKGLSTNNNTRSRITLQGKDPSGNAVTLMLGGDGDFGGMVFTHSNHKLGFATNNAAPQMALDTSGRLGIGTTAPGAKLQVAGSVHVTGQDSVANTSLQLSFTASEGHIKVKNTNASTASNLAFHTTDTSGNTNRVMSITHSGRIGINETDPQAQLVIKAPTDDNPGLVLHRNSGSGDIASIDWTSGSGTPATQGRINYRGGSGGNEGMAFYVNAGMSSPAIWASLSKRIRLPGVPGVAGSNLTNVSIESDGNLCTTTSIRAAKKNIATMTDTSWLFNLNPVTFNWRTKTQDEDGNIIWGEDTDGGTQYGLIAEEVKEVKNDFCYYDNDGNLTGVHYDRLIAPLLKAIQDLKAENTALTTRVAALEAA
jgi:hypothetical protein